MKNKLSFLRRLAWAFALLLGSLAGCAVVVTRATPPREVSDAGAEAGAPMGGTGDAGVFTFGADAQHTGVYAPAAQDLNAIHWSTPIDLDLTGAPAHYGAPLVTPANTVLVPLKTAGDGFQVNAFDGALGTAKYSLSTDYILPTYDWIPAYQPVLVTATDRLYYAGAGGTVYYVTHPDSAAPAAPVQQVFYASLGVYQSGASGFNASVFVDTPLTADDAGDVFFGFRVDGGAPAPLGTTQSGFARIDPGGNAVYVLAGTAAGDTAIGLDSHNSAPALSRDQTTLYVVVKSPSIESYAYLLGLDSTTLATRYKVFLEDPRDGNANNAIISDDSTASPMVAPDGDVYFGISANPANGSRGFLLHWSGDLTVEKPPGAFGWDYTAGIVPTSMVPSYTGPSSYLIFSKYNDYANVGSDSSQGVNKVALLDPGVTEVEPHASSNGMLSMREVLTVIGPTVDDENLAPTYPNATREWCIDTPAIDPATGSIFTPSEDGHVYRWNLAENALTQQIEIGTGIGQPYVPTVVGPDGTVFALNGGTLFALGAVPGVGVALTASTPDLCSVVVGQSLTFTASVTRTGASGHTPTGTVTFTDTTYHALGEGLTGSVEAMLAIAVPLDGSGHAAVTTAALTADAHFVTAVYSGDADFSAATASMVERVHASATTTTLVASPSPAAAGSTVTFTATVAAVAPGTGTPTGMVTFTEGSTVLGQLAVDGTGVAVFSTSSLGTGNHTVTATYFCDANFATSLGSVTEVVH